MTGPPDVSDDEIEAIRRFGRFQARVFGPMNETPPTGIIGVDVSPPQVRLLWEVAAAPAGDPPSAGDLARVLRMDPGYLSRLIKGLVASGLVWRRPSARNARRLVLTLSVFGRKEMARLRAAAGAEAAALVAGLGEAERRELVEAMARIERLLGARADEPARLSKPVAAEKEESGLD